MSFVPLTIWGLRKESVGTGKRKGCQDAKTGDTRGSEYFEWHRGLTMVLHTGRNSRRLKRPRDRNSCGEGRSGGGWKW